MGISIAGLLICAGLLILGWRLGSPTVIGLFAALPFGATAFVQLDPLGGSSPLIYTIFVILLVLGLLGRGRLISSLSSLFTGRWLPWLVLALMLYVAAGAVILPRLFAGDTTALVPVRGEVIEVLLAPTSGNFTQAGYFFLSAVCFFAFSIILAERHSLAVVKYGFFTLATVQLVLGLLDLGGKLVGVNDLLGPIRTASYVMHTKSDVDGFWRVAGGFSEASAFAATSVACLAFTFTYWRATGSRSALVLTLSFVGLLALSTSTTAYAALVVLAAALLGSVMRSSLGNRLLLRDLVVVFMMLAAAASLLAVHLSDERLLEPYHRLVNVMLLDKLDSASGIERSYWNARSLQAFWDTSGLGVGIGSSRSSSLVISIVSQLGAIGTVMMACLFGVLLRGMAGVQPYPADASMFAIASSVRAAALGAFLTASLSGGNADPGVIFFISLAVLMVCRERAVRRHGQVAQLMEPRLSAANGQP